IAPQNCITALNPTAASALVVSGGAQFNADCGIAVDSNSSGALTVNGSGTLLHADSIQIVGQSPGYTNAGTLTPTPVTGVKPVADPYANLPAPAASSSACTAQTTNVHLSGGQVTLDPGT